MYSACSETRDARLPPRPWKMSGAWSAIAGLADSVPVRPVRTKGIRDGDKTDLIEWLADALRAHGGSASIVDVCKHVWKEHEDDLRRSGDLFFTWQYDIRWAAYRLRREGRMRGEQ